MNILRNLGNRWTPAEERVLTEKWSAGAPMPDILRALPGKSASAIRCKRTTMRLSPRKRPWREAELRVLRAQWGIESLHWISRHLGRKPNSVATKAHEIGLARGTPDGWETLSQAARRTGYCYYTLRPILEWARVEMRAPYSTHHAKRGRLKAPKRLIVEAFEVDEAIAMWLKTERLAVAARRAGLCEEALMRRLRVANVAIIGGGKKGTAIRVESAEVDRALAHWRTTETLTEAATRLRVRRETLSKYLDLVGFERAVHYTRIPMGASDKAAAMFRATPRGQRRAAVKEAA